MAFLGKGRDLANAHKKLKWSFEQHPEKIQSAFICWLISTGLHKSDIKESIDLSIALEHGREKSMYTDINDDNSLSVPSSLVKSEMAIDCINLAEHCLHFTEKYLSTKTSHKTTKHEDKLFTIKTKKLVSMSNTEDFWEYLIYCLDKDAPDFNISKYISSYHDVYFCKKRKFKI